MKVLYVLLLTLLFYAEAQAEPAYLSGISVSQDCKSMELRVLSRLPLSIHLRPETYDKIPEYWRYELLVEPDTRAGACPEEEGCVTRLNSTFYGRGRQGILLLLPNGGEIRFPLGWEACRF